MPYTRITALWNGASGLPGYSRFKFAGALNSADSLAAATRVKTFFTTISTYIPALVNITFSEAAQQFSDAGVLTGEVTYTPPTSVQGGAAGNFSAPAGMVVNWLTGGVSNGRKIRGRTFLVPLSSTVWGNDGTPSSTVVGGIQGAAQALLTGTPALLVTSVTEANGAYTSSITGATVPKRAAILRSRRD